MLLQLAIAIVAAHLVWFASLVAQRLFLHPLSRIPGPKLAAATTWYEIYYDMFHHGKYIFKIQELHQKYGPIMRITPDEVHVDDPTFLDTIYASSPHRREKESARNLDVSLSVAGTSSHELHKIRREALNPFFSKRGVGLMVPMIESKVRKIEDYLQHCAKQQIPANLSDIYYALTVDVVTQYSFGFDDDILADISRAAALRHNFNQLLLGVKLRSHFGWMFALSRTMPAFLGRYFMPQAAGDMINFSRKIRTALDRSLQSKNHVKTPGKRTIFHELLDNQTLPEAEKTPDRLAQEGAFLILAGTESPAKSLGIIHYYLFANPSILARVRSELADIPSPYALADLERLPYLTAVLAEGNRLSFGLTKRNGRSAPDEVMRYESYDIPAGTLVCTSSLAVHTDESIFPEPWDFRPDRWLGPEGANARRFQFAFGKGPRKCLGINLAHAELYLAIAAVSTWDMELYETDESDVAFQHDYQIAQPKLDSRGVRAIVKGKRK